MGFWQTREQERELASSKEIIGIVSFEFEMSENALRRASVLIAHICASNADRDLEKHSIRELKDQLQAGGIPHDDCLEKRDLIERIRQVF